MLYQDFYRNLIVIFLNLWVISYTISKEMKMKICYEVVKHYHLKDSF